MRESGGACTSVKGVWSAMWGAAGSCVEEGEGEERYCRGVCCCCRAVLVAGGDRGEGEVRWGLLSGDPFDGEEAKLCGEEVKLCGQKCC